MTSDLSRRGVYQLRHTKTKRVYVGSATKSFRAAFRLHKDLLKNGRHWNAALQKDVSSLSELSFDVVSVHESLTDCLMAEQVLLNKLWGKDNIYNEVPIAGEPLLRLAGRPIGSSKTVNKRVTLHLHSDVVDFIDDVAEVRGVQASAAVNLVLMSVIQGDAQFLASLAHEHVQRKQF